MLSPIDELTENINLSQIGEAIGSGQNTCCLEPNKKWAFSKIENAVLIITREPHKRAILNSIFEGTAAKTEKIKIDKVDDSSIQSLLWELESKGLDVFFCTRLKWEQMDFKEARFFESFTQNHWANPHSNLEEWIECLQEDSELEGIKYSEYINAAQVALKRVASLIKEPVKVDLHEEQFFRDSLGNLLCIDPVYFTKLDF